MGSNNAIKRTGTETSLVFDDINSYETGFTESRQNSIGMERELL